MEFCPKKYPFFGQNQIDPFFFGKMRLTLYFWPNFLFLPEICLFVLSFYETTRFFWKKCKNGLKNGVLPKTKSTFFASFYTFFCFPNCDFTRRFLRQPCSGRHNLYSRYTSQIISQDVFSTVKWLVQIRIIIFCLEQTIFSLIEVAKLQSGCYDISCDWCL